MLLRIAILLLSGLGVFSAGSISFSHWTGVESCPVIVFIPACYIVLLAYSAIIFAMMPGLKRTKALFIVGWVPVLMLASIGVVGELTSTLQCPHTKAGIPKCYFSAALALIIGMLGLVLFRSRAPKYQS